MKPNDKIISLIPMEEIEHGAITQMYDVAQYDMVTKLAIMPDVHQGYFMPIGGVALVDGHVVPEMVGYDIGCTDKDTEFLTPSGWKKISEYKECDEVLVYDLDKKISFFEKPVEYIDVPYFGKWNAIKTKYGVDQLLTDEHKVLMFGYNSQVGISDARVSLDDYHILNACTLSEKHNSLSKGVRSLFLSTIPGIQNNGLNLSRELIQFKVALCADGCLTGNRSAIFRFKKKRKIDRLRALMTYLLFDFKENTHSGITSFSVKYDNKILKTKNLWDLKDASIDEMKIISREVFLWDGTKVGGDQFTAVDKDQCDFVQYALACSGVRSTLYHDNNDEEESWKTCAVSKNKNKEFVGISGTPKSLIVQYDSTDNDDLSRKYCFTTSTGFWVMRRNGCIAVTGNCGMCNVTTKVPANEVFQTDADKERIHHAIKYGPASIPVGFTKRTSYHPSAVDFISASCDKELSRCVNENNKLQLGTLGGGNHMIELGVNNDGFFSITIHSGSRKCGYDIAGWYMNKAKQEGKYGKFFPIDSDLGSAYLTDLAFFQEWALNNRLHMIRQVLSLIGFNCKQISNIVKDTIINENHNHAVYYDDGSCIGYVHRKGATPANIGELGVIPGNMRDGVYITRGLGNIEYLCSASHGAGRVMGRNAAKKLFNEDDFKVMMEDSECFAEVVIDECPDVYKDVELVIAYQDGIVIDVVDRIMPLVNVKG